MKPAFRPFDMVLSLFGLAGALLNARMSIWGLVLWLPVNIGLVALNLRRGYYEQAALFVGYTITSILGLIWWK